MADITVDNTAAFQACIDAAGPFGTVEFAGDYGLFGTLDVTNLAEFRGVGNRASSLVGKFDVPHIIVNGGAAQTIRNMRLRTTFTGSRLSFNIEIGNPTKPRLDSIEVDNPNETRTAGGIKFKNNGVIAGENAFMPQITSCWIRNGLLVVDQVTDGHVSDCWIWGAETGARATVDLYFANGWSFTGNDVAATLDAGCAYRVEGSKQTSIVGGYLDGGYSSYNSGYGLIGVDSSALHMSGTHFYHHGRSAIMLTGCSGMTFSSVGFYRGNKQDGGYPDIDLYSSRAITFTGTSHTQPVDRVNKGAIFREDAGSAHNKIDFAGINQAEGSYYASPSFVGNPGTLGENCRPTVLWPRPSTVPLIETPDACKMGLGPATAWPQANRAQFHRFHIKHAGTYRYIGVNVALGSGNIQAAIVRMDGLNYTRVMDSGVIACTTGMGVIDAGSTLLTAGEYALVVWVDNTTAQLRLINDEALRWTRSVAEVSSLTTGVPASGAITGWNSTARAVTACSITA
ncbi:hypothetical protein [Microbacterium sp. YJN-G]|uniref:hypothetical protein n=1 Tax=Microbacterium sp. YJN-G TaxID=2763257 RepID=UPI001877A0B5|nr:hypothetical protein [Microbacterium sp. YJN-G]